ncbi:MAG: molybdopterin cofactor-binding domain-containing protein [Sphingomonadales bacterium]
MTGHKKGRVRLTRRQMLITGAAAGGAFVIGFHLPPKDRVKGEKANSGAQINAFLRIAADDTVTVIVTQSEMGQGILTSLPMLLAEELCADWSKVAVEQAPADTDYASGPQLLIFARSDYGVEVPEILARPVGWMAGVAARFMDLQVTGGSTSIRAGWTTLRHAGAAAREMLTQAAAERWSVPVDECVAENGEVRHAPSGRSLRFGALAADAARIDPPSRPRLKSRDEYRIIGRPHQRLDIPQKVVGEARFGIDIRLPGMNYAAVKAAPVFGGTVRSFDPQAIIDRPGVKAVAEVPNGIAVVADTWWRAKKALAALPVEFDDGAHGELSSESIFKRFEKDLDSENLDTEFERGDVRAALNGASTFLEAEYRVPYLAHATMEPMNTTAWVHDGKCEIWSPTQAPLFARTTAAGLLDIDKDDVTVHTTLLGGGFGRRAMTDYVEQAVAIARHAPYPVQLIWSREEDIRHDFYRPAVLSRLKAGLDSGGRPVAWRHAFVDSAGGVDLMPYGIDHVQCRSIETTSPVPTGYWRSVDHSQHAFFIESFMDEIARGGGHDPVELRLSLLGGKPRHRKVLETVANAAGWGRPMPAGRGRGVALHRSFDAIVAQVAEVSIGTDGAPRVHRVVCAVDCGIAINPDTIEAQMESAIIFGLTAALHGEITIRNGRVVQSNFPDYPMVRLADSPAIEVHIIEGGARPGGIGEPGAPPIAPAVTNAIYDATGIRIRTLPIGNHDLRRT